MRDPRTLLIFTTAYPFGAGEPFLDAELPHLVEAFRRVMVVPTQASGLPRLMPSGVLLDVGLAESRPGRWRILASGMWTAASSPRCRHELWHEPAARSHWRAAERAVRYWGDACRTRDWMLGALARRFGASEGVLAYSYWLGRQTLGLAMAKEAAPGLAVVSRAHGSDLYPGAHTPPYLPFRAATLAGPDRLFTVSAHGLAYLTTAHPETAGRAEVARLGVEAPRARSRASDDGVFRVASCSFVTPVKRLERLVEGLAALAERHPERAFEWHHLGDGPGRPALEALASARLGARVKAHFHGHVPAGRVTTFYGAVPIDAFVNVSDSEGVPVSIMEAMSCGIPVVAPAIGGIPELVTGAAGVLLSPRPSGQAVADGLEALLDAGPARREAAFAAWQAAWRAETNHRRFAERLTRVGAAERASDARGA